MAHSGLSPIASLAALIRAPGFRSLQAVCIISYSGFPEMSSCHTLAFLNDKFSKNQISIQLTSICLTRKECLMVLKWRKGEDLDNFLPQKIHLCREIHVVVGERLLLCGCLQSQI